MKRRGQSSRKKVWITIIVVFVFVLAGGYFYYQTHIDDWLEDRYIRAEALLAQGDYNEALELYRSIIQKKSNHPKVPASLFKVGEIEALYQKNDQQALIAFLTLEKDYPGKAETLSAQKYLANIYKNRMEDYGRAIVAYQSLLEGGIGEADQIQYEIADCYFRQGNYEQARIEFLSLGKNYPESLLVPEVRYRIAVTYSLEGLSKEAENAYRNMIREWPQSPYALEARFGLASVLEERGELKAALKTLQELQGIYPEDDVLMKKIDQVTERIEKKKKAI